MIIYTQLTIDVSTYIT